MTASVNKTRNRIKVHGTGAVYQVKVLISVEYLNRKGGTDEILPLRSYLLIIYVAGTKSMDFTS